MNTYIASPWDHLFPHHDIRRSKQSKVKNDESFWADEFDALNWTPASFVNGGTTTMRELTEPWEFMALNFTEDVMIGIADRLLFVIGRMSRNTPWDSPEYEVLRQGQRYCINMLKHRESIHWVEWKELVLLRWYTFRDGSNATWHESPLPTEVVWRFTHSGWAPDRVELPEPKKQEAEYGDDWSDDESEDDSVCSDTDSEPGEGDAASYIVEDIAEEVNPADFEAAYAAEVLAALEVDLEGNSSATQQTLKLEDNDDAKPDSGDSAASEDTVRQS